MCFCMEMWNFENEINICDKYFDFKKFKVRDFKLGDDEETFIPQKSLSVSDFIDDWIDPFEDNFSKNVIDEFWRFEIKEIHYDGYEMIFNYEDEDGNFGFTVLLKNKHILKDFQKKLKRKQNRLKVTQ